MKKTLRNIIIILFLAIPGLAMMTTGLVSAYMYFMTHDRIITSPAQCPDADAVLVLGARIYPGGRPSAILYDRLASAIELYSTGKVKKFLLSGDHGSRYYDEVNTMKRFLLSRGVPPRDIFLDHAGFETYDSLYRAKNVFGAGSLVICTQRFHQYRSLYIARSLGVNATGLVADRRHYRSAIKNEAREILARVKAMAKIVLDSPPRYMGPAISLSGDGVVTWDRDIPQK